MNVLKAAGKGFPSTNKPIAFREVNVFFDGNSAITTPVVASGIAQYEQDVLFVWYDSVSQNIYGRVLYETSSLSDIVPLRSNVPSPYGISLVPISRRSYLEYGSLVSYTPWQLVWVEDVKTLYYSAIPVDHELQPIDEPELIAAIEDEGGIKLPFPAILQSRGRRLLAISIGM